MALNFTTLKQWAHSLKHESEAIYLACRDPRTPWYTKALAMVVVAYALSPIDLIPDFIPVLGYVDDLILVPAGLLLVRWMLPPEVLHDARLKASPKFEHTVVAKGRRVAAGVIIVIWLLILIGVIGGCYWRFGLFQLFH